MRSQKGIRGVFVKKHFEAGDTIWSVPLAEAGVVRNSVETVESQNVQRTVPINRDDKQAYLVCEEDSCLSAMNHCSEANTKLAIIGDQVQLSAVTRILEDEECQLCYPDKLLLRNVLGECSDMTIASACEVLQNATKQVGQLVSAECQESEKAKALADAICPGLSADLSETQKAIYQKFWGGFRPENLRHSKDGKPLGPQYFVDRHGNLKGSRKKVKISALRSSEEMKDILIDLSWWKGRVDSLEGYSLMINNEN